MIIGGISLDGLDQLYQRMGVKELFVLPWHQDGKLAGCITGAIEEFPEYPGRSTS